MFFVGDDLTVEVTATNKSSIYTALIMGYFSYRGEIQHYTKVLQPSEIYILSATYTGLTLGTSTITMGGDYVNSMEVQVYPVGYGIHLDNLRINPTSGWIEGDSLEVSVDVNVVQFAHELDNPSYRIMCMDNYWAQIQNYYVNINGSGTYTVTFTWTNLAIWDHSYWVIDFIDFSEHISANVTANVIGPCNSLPETDQTTSSFIAHWDTPTGRVDGYFLDVDDSYSFISYTRYNVGLVNSYEVTGYPESPFGPVGYYRVMGYNFAVTGTSSDYEQFDLLPIAPAKPYTPYLAGNLFGTGFGVVTLGNSEDQSISLYYYFWDLSEYSDFSVLIEDKVKEFGYGVKTHGFTGLLPGHTYYYRCYARRGTDPEYPYSPVSDYNTQMTPLPAAAPTGTTATSITKTSFQMNFILPAGATHTLISVSLYSDFHTYIEPYSDLYIEDPPRNYKIINSGLAAGTDYYYKLFCSSPGGDTPYSNIVSIRTLEATPGEPTTTAGTSVTSDSFYANWTSGSGVIDGYLLDVSDDGFSSYVGVYHNLDVGNVNTYPVISLPGGIEYGYRLRSYNNGGTSTNESNVTYVSINPDAPTQNDISAISTTSFRMNWDDQTEATQGYIWEVGLDVDFNSLLISGRTLSHTTIYKDITTATQGTQYWTRLKSNGDGGYSDWSNVKTCTTESTANLMYVTFEDVLDSSSSQECGTPSFNFQLDASHTIVYLKDTGGTLIVNPYPVSIEVILTRVGTTCTSNPYEVQVDIPSGYSSGSGGGFNSQYPDDCGYGGSCYQMNENTDHIYEIQNQVQVPLVTFV